MSSCLLRKNRPAENASCTVNVLRLGKKRAENERGGEEEEKKEPFHGRVSIILYLLDGTRSDRRLLRTRREREIAMISLNADHASDDLCKAVAKLDRNGA